MFDPLIAGAAVLALLTQTPDSISFSRCRAESRTVGACAWRPGRFIVVNGSHSSRIGFFRGAPAGIAVHQPGEDAPNEYAPEGVAALLLGSPTSVAVDGTYLVCPLAQPRSARHDGDTQPTIACLAGTKKLIKRKLSGY